MSAEDVVCRLLLDTGVQLSSVWNGQSYQDYTPAVTANPAVEHAFLEVQNAFVCCNGALWLSVYEFPLSSHWC